MQIVFAYCHKRIKIPAQRLKAISNKTIHFCVMLDAFFLDYHAVKEFSAGTLRALADRYS